VTGPFRTLSFYEKVPPFAFPGLGGFVTTTPPPGTWPTAHGGAGRTGRAAEPLVHDRFALAWWAPLGRVEHPDGILVGGGHVVVEGAERRAIWTVAGRTAGTLIRAPGAALIDVQHARLLANDVSGVGVYTLAAQRESTLKMAAPADGITSALLQGPGALVVVTLHERPHGPARAVVETVRVRDYTAIKDEVLYGIEPLAGITREDDADVVAAAASQGPVLATPVGLDWRDWQLRPRGHSPLSAHPVALSVDEHDHAYLLSDSGGLTRLQGLDAAGATRFDTTLPIDDGPFSDPPLIAASGQIYLTSPHAILALSPTGQLLWRRPAERSPALATLTSNGVLLVAGDTLDAVTSDGDTTLLWRPPAPLLTAPVLADERIYVASAEALFVLQPAAP
jgi:hypothetical protein